MRILLLAPQLSVGGLERQISLLGPALARAGHDVAVAVWNFDPSERYVDPLREAGIEVVPIEGGHAARKLLHLAGEARRRRSDVVHSYSFYTNAAAALAAWATPGAVSVGSIRGDLDVELRRTGRVLGRLSAGAPRAIVANSRAARDRATRRGRWGPRAVAFVANGVDLDGYDPDPGRIEEPPLIVGVGALDHRKSWDRAIAAAAGLRARGVPFRMAVAGDGPDRGALQDQIDRADLDGQVELLGTVDDPRDLYGRAAVVVLTSQHEGMPNVVLEAMASGRAVVAHDVGDVDDLVTAAGAGRVVAPNDLGALTDALAHYLGAPERAVDAGRRGRARAEADHSVEALVARTCRAYDEARAARRRSTARVVSPADRLAP